MAILFEELKHWGNANSTEHQFAVLAWTAFTVCVCVCVCLCTLSIIHIPEPQSLQSDLEDLI